MTKNNKMTETKIVSEREDRAKELSPLEAIRNPLMRFVHKMLGLYDDSWREQSL